VTVGIGTVFLNDGEVKSRMDPSGWLLMGRFPEGIDPLVEAVAEQCRNARLDARVTPRIMQYKWGRVLNNLRNAVGAITNASRADCVELSDLAKNELIGLLDEAGIAYATTAQIAKQWPELNTEVPQFTAGEAQSSTWQSLARKSGSVETDFFNGEAVWLAHKLGKDAPINNGLNRIVQEMAAKRETPGKYSITELKERLLKGSQN
jgi:2-dehydropantoate 2-reductase